MIFNFCFLGYLDSGSGGLEHQRKEGQQDESLLEGESGKLERQRGTFISHQESSTSSIKFRKGACKLLLMI